MISSVDVIGHGRVGSAVAARLAERGVAVDAADAELVLLCVPDRAIREAASAVAPGPWVAHVSGATPLAALDPHARRFGVHPLQTFTRRRGPEQLDGAWAAVTAESEEAREVGTWLARTLGLRPFDLDDRRRALYHGGAAVASNFLVTLRRAAGALLEEAGAPPEALDPLMLRTVENDFELTGPIERGDWDTVARHLEAIRAARPDLERAYRALADLTAALHAGHAPPAPPPRDAEAPRDDAAALPCDTVSQGVADAAGAAAEAAPRVCRTVRELREALRPLRAGRIGLVPTMGALHEGHLSLLRAARAECDTVVMSIFVNPAQFADPADLAAYPRDEARDLRLATAAGVDLVFAPGAEEVYPPGFQTWVEVTELGAILEGEHRPGHFRGVATVCLKLFNAVRPDLAYFGQKDAQQVEVLRRLVLDLDLDLELRALPTVRDHDGLALSSRNALLTTEQRERALALPRALATGDPERARELLDGLDVDYVAAAPFRPPVLAAAVRVGGVRLIDNVPLPGGDP